MWVKQYQPAMDGNGLYNYIQLIYGDDRWFVIVLPTLVNVRRHPSLIYTWMCVRVYFCV